MNHRIFAASLAAAAFAATPIAAQAAQAEITRSTPAAEDASKLGSGIGPAFIIIALAAAGMAVLLLTDNDDEPMSA